MIGLRVRQVREILGWSQTHLAELSGLAQGRISEIESGYEPTPDQLASIGAATGFPIAWFTGPVFEPFSEGTILFRKRSRAPKTDDRRAVRRLELAAEIVAFLGEGLRLPPVRIAPLPADAVDDIESAAGLARVQLHLPAEGPIPNLTRAVERSGAIVVGLPVDLGHAGRVQHHHGISAWPSIHKRPVIGFSTTDPGDRQRHTLAHELGHLLLHRGSAPDVRRDSEREASVFAGALLMPADDARAAFKTGFQLRDLAVLKGAWGISIVGLIVRAHQVGAITKDRQESLFRQLSTRGWRTKEPVLVHRENPALLRRLIDARFGKEPDWRRVGRALHLPPHLVREIVEVGAPDRTRDTGSVPVITLQRA